MPNVGFEPTAIGSRIRRSVQTELHEQGTLLVGIEPTANGLKVRRSVTELQKLTYIELHQV